MRAILLLFLVPLILSSQWFTKVTTGPQSNDGGDSRSAVWVDYDDDGDLDLFFTNGSGVPVLNFLYRNNGNGTFTRITDASVASDPGSYDGSTWADADNDGWIDAFSVTWYGQRNAFHRQRNGVFEKVQSRTLVDDATYSETASWADIDNDGFVDLYIANSAGDLKNIFYHNNGDGTFTKKMDGPHVNDAVPSRSVDWADLDNDGDLDLFVANEGGADESLYWNNGDGTFTAETASPLVHDGGDSFGSSVGDIDNDGDLDILIVNHAFGNEALFLNNGDHTFTKVTGDPVVTSGGSSVGSAFGDLDNDGDLDLVVTNAFTGSSATKNFLFLNDGSGHFTKIDTGIVSNDPGWSYGVALGDYDRDGDLDIAMGNCFGANQNNALYRNEGNGNAWLTVRCVGTVSNRSAIGARVRVKAVINGKPVWQLRQVAGQSGYCGQNLESHFGLGNASVIDSLVVIFPSGTTVVQTNVSPRAVLTVTEPMPAGFFRGMMQIGTFRGMAPMTVQFRDISRFDPAHPSSSWQWDLNGDGITDATTKDAERTYTTGDTVSVRLIVGNGMQTDTIVSPKAIVVLPAAAILRFNAATHNFGVIDVNTPMKDTVMYIYNTGSRADSLTIGLVYGSTSSGTVKPDTALALSPRSAILPPNDSLKITYTMYPPRFIRTNLNITYTPKIVITSAHNDGPKNFEKTMWVKLQGTLMEMRAEMSIPYRFALGNVFPNPFNPSATIPYVVPGEQGSSLPVRLKIFDLLGREVATIVNEQQSAGPHHATWTAAQIPSGIYFCRYAAGDRSEVRRLVLMK